MHKQNKFTYIWSVSVLFFPLVISTWSQWKFWVHKKCEIAPLIIPEINTYLLIQIPKKLFAEIEHKVIYKYFI